MQFAFSSSVTLHAQSCGSSVHGARVRIICFNESAQSPAAAAKGPVASESPLPEGFASQNSVTCGHGDPPATGPLALLQGSRKSISTVQQQRAAAALPGLC